MYQIVYLDKVSNLLSFCARPTSRQGARPSQQGPQQESQPTKATWRKWSHIEYIALLNVMGEMVNTGVYKEENGVKPGYLTYLEEALKISCPTLMIKARPHIEPRIKTLKRYWFIVNDMIHGVKHSFSGFDFNSTSNMVVEEDDVWDDYIVSFIHYEKCCLVFGNDRATREDAFDAVDAMEDLGGGSESNSENESDLVASEDVEVTQRTSQSQYIIAEVTSNPNKRKKCTSDGGLAEYMISTAQILGYELSKASNDISAAINADRDMRHLVMADMEEVPEILEVDMTMYNAKHGAS
ncbi:hypothetical protein Syun_017335 [Stephania yunnanensis]|uniref:Myb/SANT-like domain-containing protein n=1 Tax=Stephania yunnanensis TaxID=152371 RepID=A0AAP0J900_9MAGN